MVRAPTRTRRSISNSTPRAAIRSSRLLQKKHPQCVIRRPKIKQFPQGVLVRDAAACSFRRLACISRVCYHMAVKLWGVVEKPQCLFILAYSYAGYLTLGARRLIVSA